MAPSIRPLATDMRLAGVAATVRCVAVDGSARGSQRVASRHDRGRRRARAGRRARGIDLRGGLLGRAARHRVAPARRARRRRRRLRARHAGADRHGLRDVRPRHPLRRRARPHPRRRRRRGDRMRRRRSVNPGDFVLGDHDGVVVLPAAIAAEAIALAEEKMAGENRCATRSPRACPWPRRSGHSGCSEPAAGVARRLRTDPRCARSSGGGCCCGRGGSSAGGRRTPPGRGRSRLRRR